MSAKCPGETTFRAATRSACGDTEIQAGKMTPSPEAWQKWNIPA